MQRLKSQLTDEQLYKIQKDRVKMNKYKAGDPIRNVYQDTLISRVANYKNKATAAGEGHPSNLGESAAPPATNDEDDQTQQEQPTTKKKGIFTPRKETSLSEEKLKK